MSNPFSEKPILNSPYAYPQRHWELDEEGQPTQHIIETRRKAAFITPIPKSRKRKGGGKQQDIVFDEGKGLSTQAQQYDPTPIINELRRHIDRWRALPNPGDWQVTPETARLLQHWRHHKSSGIRPFFCQIEAIETAIWLTEVAPQAGKLNASEPDRYYVAAFYFARSSNDTQAHLNSNTLSILKVSNRWPNMDLST